MSILDYIYNKNSLHIVNALRIVCIIAVITIFVFFIAYKMDDSVESRNDVGLVFLGVFAFILIPISSIVLVGTGTMDIINYNKK